MSFARATQRVHALFLRPGATYARNITISSASQRPILEHLSRQSLRAAIRTRLGRRNFTTKGRWRAEASSQPEAQASRSLSQRLKDLSREYGWTAVGVYFALSALDFPFCYLAVVSIGTEKIARFEHWAVEYVKKAIPFQIPEKYKFWKKTQVGEDAEQVVKQAEKDLYDHGYNEAVEAHQGEASLGTKLALAYAIHKSFIFIRVPLTAAVLPKIVKTLRGWGWKIGKRRPKVDKNAIKPTIPQAGIKKVD